MKNTYVVITALLMLSILIPMYAFAPVSAAARSDIDLTFYASPDAAYTALTAGQADFLVWALTKEQKDAAELNPNIQICRVDEQGMYEFDLNNNYTILSYPGVRSATNDLNVRKAIAFLTDKQFIVANILLFFGTRIDAPMSATSAAAWADPQAVYPNYAYEYNPASAAAALTAAGFADTDSNGWLNYPAGWDGAPGADTTAYPLVVCVRSDHGHRLSAGQYIINQLEVTLASTAIGAGFKTTGTTWQQPRSVLSPKVMGNRDFNIYTGGWSVGRFPTHLFFLFHSMFWYPYGSSYVTGMNKSNLPNYPDSDLATEDIWYTASVSTAQVASKAWTLMHEDKCMNVALWAYSSYWAYSKNLAGVVNEDGYGIENDYTFMNAYRVDVAGAPIRVAVTNGPDRLNILYSQWYFEYSFLNRVYTGGLGVQPYDLATDVPWVVQDWEVATWDDAGTTKSLVTYYIRKDVGIVNPVTGTFIRNWDADDFEYTIWYNYAFTDSWQWGTFMDVRYTKIVDVNSDGWNEFQVYFDDQSYWFYSAPLYPFLTKPETLDLLNAQTTDTWAQAGTGEKNVTYNVVQVVSATLGGTPLVEGTDYVIRAGYDRSAHDMFVPLHTMTGTIVLTYWYADTVATGFFLAGFDWTQTMFSLATHYPVSVTTNPPGLGDTFVMKKNPSFFLATPLLGEIDYAWKWASGAKPRSGNFKIEIFDVVRATGAYCTRGDGVFNPKFFPGADLDSSDLCHIGIFDLVSITGKYGKTFGAPPA